MGKRKTRTVDIPFQTDTECLSTNHPKIDKLRQDLYLTTVKQQKLIRLIRNEIPDSFDHETRNFLHSTTNLLLYHVDKTQTVVSDTWDHSTHLFKKRKNNATKKASN
jgi:hypothetical protein